ncbi:MAG: hypothetical protein ACI37Q_01965 [Candidatus Gastranaerophilaceae bacterium]
MKVHKIFTSKVLNSKHINRLKELKLKGTQLTPLRNIDGEIITLDSKSSRVYPTEFEDCFERMSFETNEEVDCFRTKELYDKKTDYEKCLHSKYSDDDIPLSESEIDKHYGRINIHNSFYPDTYMFPESQKTLAFINFIENIIPSSLENPATFTDENIRDLASLAAHLYSNGVSKSKIITYLEKSKLIIDDLHKRNPSIELFDFISKYPTKRRVAITTDAKGSEILDLEFVNHFNNFAKRYFKDEETALKVLEECKTIGRDGIRVVNNDLCEIAILLRKKSAMGIPSDNQFYLHSYERLFASYCDKNEEWTDKCSELLKDLKNEDGTLNSDAFEAAKQMLKFEDRDINFVLNELPGKTRYTRELSEIQKYLDRDANYKFPTAKEDIQNLLNEEYVNYSNGKTKFADNKMLIKLTKYMTEKEYQVTDINAALKFIVSERETKPHLTFDEALYLIKTCFTQNTKGEMKFNRLLKSFIQYLYKIKYNLGNYDDELIKEFAQKTTNNKDYQKAFKDMCSMEVAPRVIIDNIDKVVEYNEIHKMFWWNKEYTSNMEFIKSVLNNELYNKCRSTDFTVENCKVRNAVKTFGEKELSIDDLIELLKET